jgi:dTDP-4-dehydrorhamnose 3,5-epimerase
MRVFPTSLRDVLIIEPDVYVDERGLFYESYNERTFAEHVTNCRFVQDNCSKSTQHVLRGLHYQLREPQGKLVRVVSGEIFDVAVDLRKASPTFGQWTGHTLTAESKQSVWIPPGFAHGFLVLCGFADIVYKTTAYWAPQDERCVIWNDPDLSINWPLTGQPILSSRDGAGSRLRQADVYT